MRVADAPNRRLLSTAQLRGCSLTIRRSGAVESEQLVDPHPNADCFRTFGSRRRTLCLLVGATDTLSWPGPTTRPGPFLLVPFPLLGMRLTPTSLRSAIFSQQAGTPTTVFRDWIWVPSWRDEEDQALLLRRHIARRRIRGDRRVVRHAWVRTLQRRTQRHSHWSPPRRGRGQAHRYGFLICISPARERTCGRRRPLYRLVIRWRRMPPYDDGGGSKTDDQQASRENGSEPEVTHRRSATGSMGVVPRRHSREDAPRDRTMRRNGNT